MSARHKAVTADVFDYASVTPDTVRADVESALAAADRRLAELVARPPANALAVVTALDDVQADVFALQGRTAFLDLVHPDERVRAAGSEARTKIAGWESGLLLRDDVADLVAGLSSPDALPTPEGREASRLVAHWKRDVRRTGHGLPDDVRDEIRTLRRRLAEIESIYQNNITDDDAGIDVTRDDLEGLPSDWFDALGPARGPSAEQETRHVSLAFPQLFPFLTQARRRDLRRELLTRWWSRAAAPNRPLLEEGLALRRRLADLLGYQSWADYATEVRMTGSAARVVRFLDDLTKLSAPSGTVNWQTCRNS